MVTAQSWRRECLIHYDGAEASKNKKQTGGHRPSPRSSVVVGGGGLRGELVTDPGELHKLGELVAAHSVTDVEVSGGVPLDAIVIVCARRFPNGTVTFKCAPATRCVFKKDPHGSPGNVNYGCVKESEDEKGRVLELRCFQQKCREKGVRTFPVRGGQVEGVKGRLSGMNIGVRANVARLCREDNATWQSFMSTYGSGGSTRSTYQFSGQGKEGHGQDNAESTTAQKLGAIQSGKANKEENQIIADVCADVLGGVVSQIETAVEGRQQKAKRTHATQMHPKQHKLPLERALPHTSTITVIG
jgi:hypothetical protein